MSDEVECACCDSRLMLQWSDTHGVGVCVTCGLPYRIYHYEGEGNERKRVEKPPETVTAPEWIAMARIYWAETRQRVFPGDFDLGFNSGRERTYSGATQSDIEEFWKWVEAHPEHVPAAKEEVT